MITKWGGGEGGRGQERGEGVPTALGQTETRTNLPNKCNPFAKKKKKKERKRK